MKQFIICFLLSVWIYIIGSIVGKTFNPMEWCDTFGTMMVGYIITLIWVAPTILKHIKEN